MDVCRFLLVLSVSTGAAAGLPPALAGPVPTRPGAVTVPGGRLWTRGGSGAVTAAGTRVFALTRGPRDADGAPLDAAGLADLLGAGPAGVPAGPAVSAPFAAAAVDPAGRVAAAVDPAGLGQVHSVPGPGWSALSSSALELARLRAAPLDTAAIGGYRMVGHYLGASTPFRGVSTLGPGGSYRMADGVLSTTAGPGPGCDADLAPAGTRRGADLARRHAARLREVVAAFLDHYPDAVLELSGGLDSRMVLAAVPPDRRAGLRAVTLTYPGAPDGLVATGLAGRYRLAHQTVDVAGVVALDPAAAYQAVRAAAVRTDALGAPLSAAVFDWAERQVDPAPRLGGHGGELARGAYYLQRQHPRVEPALVDQLARWWITGNNAVPDEVLAPRFAADSRADTRRRLREIFAGYRADWLTATDEFYLRQRLHRWAGPTLADAARSRVVANPLLDPWVLALVRAVPRERRSGSRYAAEVLGRLDPELARLPLGSGVRPAALARRLTLSRTLGENTIRGFTAKAAGKVSRRLLAQGRPPVGAAALAALVCAHWRANPHLLAPVAATGLVHPQWLDRFLAGTAAATAATVDFLVNLGVAAEVGAAPGGRPPAR